MLRESACPTVTTLGLKQVNDSVNLESDLIGKYVERLFQERGQVAPKPTPVIAKTICRSEDWFDQIGGKDRGRSYASDCGLDLCGFPGYPSMYGLEEPHHHRPGEA